nr:MAG TPA: hypothetical protein [Crassvirales sp.]
MWIVYNTRKSYKLERSVSCKSNSIRLYSFKTFI